MIVPQTDVRGGRERSIAKIDTIEILKSKPVFRKNSNIELVKSLGAYTKLLDSITNLTSNSVLILKMQQKEIRKQTETLKCKQ